MESILDYTRPVLVLDLDDTLFPEADFAFSGYKAIAAEIKRRNGAEPTIEQLTDFLPHIMTGAREAGENPMDAMVAACGRHAIPIDEAVEIYRSHTPELTIQQIWLKTLDSFAEQGIATGIITDGRSHTQRAKIRALGIERFFPAEDIMISEEQGFSKTEPAMFRHFVSKYPNASAFIYVGDNPAKDFRRPALMGWHTVGLRGTEANIHPQTGGFQPSEWIDSPEQLTSIVNRLKAANTL